MVFVNWPALAAAILSLVVAFYMDPEVLRTPMKQKSANDADGSFVAGESYDRLTFSVKVGGQRLHCWLFSPKKPVTAKAGPFPVVVAAYGLGVQKDMALLPLAAALTKEGFAVVLFDYRHWGVSEGQPRHIADHRKHVEDVRGVLQHIHNTKGFDGAVDAKRIALYGASLGGGVVLAAASQMNKEKDPLNQSVKAVVAAIPFVSGKDLRNAGLKRRGFFETLRTVGAIMQDLFLAQFSPAKAVYIRIARPAGSAGLSAMELEHKQYDIWASRTPLTGKTVAGSWENRLAARSFYILSAFQPDQLAANFLNTPTLVIAGSNDSICPIDSIKDMIKHHEKHSGKKQIFLKEYPLEHFDFLTQQHFPKLAEPAVQFLKEHL